MEKPSSSKKILTAPAVPTSKYHSLYLPADTTITFNDGTWNLETGQIELDHGIAPIIKALPPCPDIKTIAGYGLHPKDQYWENLRPQPPQKLAELIADTELSNEQKIAKLDNNPEYFKEEIEFILWHHKAIREGWWMFNNGKPTPITHDHMHYLTVWLIDGENPEFRMRDYEVHWAIKTCCDDDDLCLGINRPKERQIGETNIVCNTRLRRACTIPYFKTGMQSKDEKHAAFIHEMMIYENWRTLPFYLAPIWNGDANSVSEIKFFSPKFPGRPGYKKKALNSLIDYRDSGEKAYDGVPQIKLIHNDEIGKVGEDSSVDVYVRWEKQKYCLKHGANKTGFGINTSTVDEMEFKGGKAFKKIADESHAFKPLKTSKDYKDRDSNGWTGSGLYNIFIPSNEGFLIEQTLPNGQLRRSIDKYGFADVEWTTKYLMAERKAKKQGKMEDYLALLRERPLQWDECWLYNVKDCNFDIGILRARLDELAYMNPKPWRKGNFVWKDGVPDTLVEWVDDENGRSYISKLLPLKESNRVLIQHGKRVPDNWLQFVLGCDPYKYGKKKGSDGGGSVFWKRNYNMDREDTDITLFKTYNWVWTYSHRHRHLDQYAEDMIMASHYFGCKMAEETNFSYLNGYFERRGYAAFLHRFFDKDGILNEQAGQDSQQKQKMEYFRILDDFISKHGMRVNHPEVLEDCMKLQEDFQPFDRLVSCAISLKAAREDEFYIPKNTIHKGDVNKALQEYWTPNTINNGQPTPILIN